MLAFAYLCHNQDELIKEESFVELAKDCQNVPRAEGYDRWEGQK